VEHPERTDTVAVLQRAVDWARWVFPDAERQPELEVIDPCVRPQRAHRDQRGRLRLRLPLASDDVRLPGVGEHRRTAGPFERRESAEV
jgi:hypothetical protein